MTPNHRKPYRDDLLGCFRVPLTMGKTALIDAEDVAAVGQHVWHVATSNRPTRRIYREDKTVLLSHQIMGPGRIKYMNGDPLDCRRRNLVRASMSEIRVSGTKHDGCSSQYIGVSWQKYWSRWQAYISINGKRKWLGKFREERRAAEVRDAAAIKYFGEHARLNFPVTQEIHR